MDQIQKILTVHPQGKKGVNILQSKYDTIFRFIMEMLKKGNAITYESLNAEAVKKLSPTFDGKVAWYLVTVKLDMEARGVIERVPKTSPHKIRLSTKA